MMAVLYVAYFDIMRYQREEIGWLEQKHVYT